MDTSLGVDATLTHFQYSCRQTAAPFNSPTSCLMLALARVGRVSRKSAPRVNLAPASTGHPPIASRRWHFWRTRSERDSWPRWRNSRHGARRMAPGGRHPQDSPRRSTPRRRDPEVGASWMAPGSRHPEGGWRHPDYRPIKMAPITVGASRRARAAVPACHACRAPPADTGPTTGVGRTGWP